MTNRRAFLTACAFGLLAAPMGAAAAQQPRRTGRVGWVAIGLARSSVFLETFREGMREHGWTEGQNLTLATRAVERVDQDRIAELTRELVGLNVDVIVALGPAVYGVRNGAGPVPVVFATSGDPVEAKLVASLAHPGGSLTGMTFLSLELAGKRLELLREAFPSISRVAILANPAHAGEQAELRESQAAARRLALSVQYLPVRAATDFDTAFDAITRERAEALLAFPDALITSQQQVIADFAAKRRIPTISGWAEFAEVGNLMTYGPNLRDSYRRVAIFVDKILRGARPADLPVERPTRFELVLNLKTAAMLGITLPQSILVRADRVIQ